jgi:hypothetical protein
MLRLQKLFDAPTDKHWDKRFDFGHPIEFRVLDLVDLLHGCDGHISFARQSFDVRFLAGNILRVYHRVVAHFGDSVMTEHRMLQRIDPSSPGQGEIVRAELA